MKVLIFGATGMVGQGVLRECLLSAEVSEVIAIGRTRLESDHLKLRQPNVSDLQNLSSVADELQGADAAFFCIGSSSAGVNEQAYRVVNFDLPTSVAKQLLLVNPAMTFIYVSGAGADSTGKSSTMWARVRGETENLILGLPFAHRYVFRPGVIEPLHGARSKTRSYRLIYQLMTPLFPLLRWLLPDSVLSTERIGTAMLNLVGAERPNGVLTPSDIRRCSNLPRHGRATHPDLPLNNS